MRTSSLESIGVRVLARASPPSIVDLIACMERGEEYGEFMHLVHEFVPEVEKEVRRQHAPSAKMHMFAETFENRYFPLYPGITMDEEYSALIRQIPIVLLSIDWDSYCEISSGDFDPGITLLAYIIENPWQQGEGERIALAETCARWVPENILQRVPEEIKREDIHTLLDGTRFEAVGIVADILHMLTGNCFYDQSQESADQNSADLEWTRENVEELTRKWLQAQVLRDKAENLYEYLEQDPPGHFAELVDFIEARKKFLKIAPKALVEKYKPSKANIQWANNLVKKLSIGGVWVAPIGFTFRKTGERELSLISYRDTAAIREVLERTLAICRVSGITVTYDVQARFPEGGDHDDNRGTTGTQRVPAITMAVAPDPRYRS